MSGAPMLPTSKPLLLLQLRPEDATSDGEYACVLRVGGLVPEEVHRVRIERSGIPEGLSLDDYCGIIVGGSPFDISTPAAEKSAIQNRIEDDFQQLLEEVIERDFPFLGACSGNGLLGNYLGATISRRYGEPVSSVEVTLTDAGREDRLLQGFPERFGVLLGHKEACDSTPEGSTLLVTGEACPVQMFRVGQNIYATQFHPEADVEEFTLRINTYRNHGYFEPEEAEQVIAELDRYDASLSNRILSRFVVLCRETPCTQKP